MTNDIMTPAWRDFLVIGLAWALVVPADPAHSANLVNEPFTPNTASGSLKFSESYGIRRGKNCAGNDPVWSPCWTTKVTSGGFTISGILSLEGFDITQFNQA